MKPHAHKIHSLKEASSASYALLFGEDSKQVEACTSVKPFFQASPNSLSRLESFSACNPTAWNQSGSGQTEEASFRKGQRVD